MIFETAKLLIYFLLVHATLLIPGYILINKINKGLSDEEKICFGFVVTVSIYALLGVLYFLFYISNIVILFITIIIFSYSVYELVRLRLFKRIFVFSWIVMFVFSGIAVIYVFLPFNNTNQYIPDPVAIEGRNYDTLNVKILNIAHTPANDNYIPFRQAQFFVNRMDIQNDSFISEWGVNFFFRTPLMGAVSSFYFILTNEYVPKDYLWNINIDSLNDIYQKYQIIVSILNSLFILSAFLLLKTIFNKRIAVVSIMFIFFNSYFLYNTFFSWPKLLVAFFVLSSWYVLIKYKSIFWASILMSISFWSHDLTILYLIGTLFFVFYIFKSFRSILYFLFLYFILVSPWFVISKILYHQSSLFYMYPFFLEGIPASTSGVIYKFFHTPLSTILAIKLNILYYLLIPYHLIEKVTFPLLDRIWVDSIYSIPGAVGLSIFWIGYVNLISQIMIGKRFSIILSFIIAPLISVVFVIGWPMGIAALHFAQALVVVLIGFSIEGLLLFKSKITIIFFLVISIILSIINDMYNYNFNFINWLTYPNVILVLFIIVSAVIVCVVSMREIKNKNT